MQVTSLAPKESACLQILPCSSHIRTLDGKVAIAYLHGGQPDKINMWGGDLGNGHRCTEGSSNKDDWQRIGVPACWSLPNCYNNLYVRQNILFRCTTAKRIPCSLAGRAVCCVQQYLEMCWKQKTPNWSLFFFFFHQRALQLASFSKQQEISVLKHERTAQLSKWGEQGRECFPYLKMER